MFLSSSTLSASKKWLILRRLFTKPGIQELGIEWNIHSDSVESFSGFWGLRKVQEDSRECSKKISGNVHNELEGSCFRAHEALGLA